MIPKAQSKDGYGTKLNKDFKITPSMIPMIEDYLATDTMEVEVPDVELTEKQVKHNNTGVRKPIPIELNDLHIAEWIKCSRDPVYFIKKYCYIISLDDGLIKFKLFPYQEKLIRKFQKYRFNIPMQSRQTGKTTTSAAFILWYAIFHGAKNVAILANKQAQAQETVERVTTMLENLPFFLQPGNKTLNKRSMEFGNKSKIFSAATSSSSIRGQSVNLLYLDEFAHVQNDVQFFESTYPVITSGKKTRAIITSTPNGAKGMFYKLWKDSEEKKNSYKRTLVIWNEVPGRDKKWAEETRRNIGGEAQWRQEFLCEFVGTVGSLISGSVLQAIPSQEPISVEGDDLCLSIFEEAQEGHIYMMTVDVSRGVGNDYSAVIVTDVSVAPYKIVARYKNNLIDANLFPDVIYAIGSRYNDAYAVVETNDLGETVVNTLWDEFEYENIVSTYSVKGKGQVATLGYSSKNVFGVKTTASTKRIGCANLKSLVEDGTYLINDLACQTELSTFIQKNNSFQADEGCHDDLAMCLVIFSWFTGQDLFKNLTDDSIRDKLLEKMKRDQYQDMMPVIPNTEEELSFLVEDGDVWVTEDHPEFGSYFTPNQF